MEEQEDVPFVAFTKSNKLYSGVSVLSPDLGNIETLMDKYFRELHKNSAKNLRKRASEKKWKFQQKESANTYSIHHEPSGQKPYLPLAGKEIGSLDFMLMKNDYVLKLNIIPGTLSLDGENTPVYSVESEFVEGNANNLPSDMVMDKISFINTIQRVIWKQHQQYAPLKSEAGYKGIVLPTSMRILLGKA